MFVKNMFNYLICKLKKLSKAFFQGDDVVRITKQLLGKIITTNFEGELTSGKIVEAEAYRHVADEASHARRGKRTNRNEHMYASGGVMYVYICYGLHHMVNVVTNLDGIPDAILIRAIEPVSGLEIMAHRTGKKTTDKTITKGPGNVAKALGVYKKHSGRSFTGNEKIFITDPGIIIEENEVVMSPRIGVDGAGADALLPYRFFIKGNKYVSGKTNFSQTNF